MNRNQVKGRVDLVRGMLGEANPPSRQDPDRIRELRRGAETGTQSGDSTSQTSNTEPRTRSQMYLQVGYDIVFEHPVPTPIIAMLYLHPSRSASVRRGEHLLATPEVPVTEYTDLFGNRCGRLVAPAGTFRLWNDALVKDSGAPDSRQPLAPQLDIHDLPPETIQFLIPSRYCEVDQMVDLAWQLFGSTENNWTRVQAICDFVHQHITFDYVQARATRTALQAYHEKVGVCRDYTHLAIAFCRCMNLPARYCTGYLGDIGVPPGGPMDFSAWMEVYLGNRWYTFDPRHNVPRIGRVLMAIGRDAADVALVTSFGRSRLDRFSVWTNQVDIPTLEPISVQQNGEYWRSALLPGAKDDSA